MDEVGLFEAWGKWARGDLTEQAQLWGMSILWWGRIGKLTGLAAALTIIAEIVGAERLRAFGNSMHKMIEPKRCLRLPVDVGRWMMAQMVSLFSQDKTIEKPAIDKLFVWSFALVFLGTWIMVIITAIRKGRFWGVFTEGLIGGFGRGAWYGTLVMFVVAMSLCGLGFILAAVDVVVIEPIARRLEGKDLGKRIKVASVVLLILGFHFDLLAS
jgi:hypothetical protein